MAKQKIQKRIIVSAKNKILADKTPTQPQPQAQAQPQLLAWLSDTKDSFKLNESYKIHSGINNHLPKNSQANFDVDTSLTGDNKAMGIKATKLCGSGFYKSTYLYLKSILLDLPFTICKPDNYVNWKFHAKLLTSSNENVKAFEAVGIDFKNLTIVPNINVDYTVWLKACILAERIHLKHIDDGLKQHLCLGSGNNKGKSKLAMLTKKIYKPDYTAYKALKENKHINGSQYFGLFDLLVYIGELNHWY